MESLPTLLTTLGDPWYGNPMHYFQNCKRGIHSMESLRFFQHCIRVILGIESLRVTFNHRNRI